MTHNKNDFICHTHCNNPAEEPHTCPFQEDIYDDHEFECTCCDECTYECLMDI